MVTLRNVDMHIFETARLQESVKTLKLEKFPVKQKTDLSQLDEL